jgi:SMODS and SLOG-associating 2TM effector domain family 4
MSLDPGCEYVLGTARELYGRVVYTHKTHEQEREIWAGKSCTLNRINVGLTALTTVFAVVSATFKPNWALITTALFAGTSVGFVVYQSSFDPAAKENLHRTAAKELLWIREQLLLLIADCNLPSISITQLQHSLEMITRELTAVYKFAPNTSPEAYKRAEKMIKSGQFTFTDDEIDELLPPVLRK